MPSEIHIFDLDDTLLITPTFADLIGQDERLDDFLKKTKQAFLLFASKEVDLVKKGDFIVLVDSAKGTPISISILLTFKEKLEGSEAAMKPEAFKKHYGISRSTLKDITKALGEMDGHVIVTRVSGFHGNPETIGSTTNPEVIGAYHAAVSKMILTGRGTALIPDITARLSELGMVLPNQGLHCFDGSGSIQEFKIRTILDAVKEKQWEIVHFFEDRLDWLKAAQEAVQQSFPHVDFVKHHISNVHGGRNLG